MCTGDFVILWAEFTQASSEAGPEGNGPWSSEILGQVQVWLASSSDLALGIQLGPMVEKTGRQRAKSSSGWDQG